MPLNLFVLLLSYEQDISRYVQWTYMSVHNLEIKKWLGQVVRLKDACVLCDIKLSCYVVNAWCRLEEVPLYMSKGLTAKCCRCWVLVQRGTLGPTGRHPSTTKPALPSSTFWHQRWAPSHGSCSPASPRTYCCYCFAWAWHYSVLFMLTLTYRLFFSCFFV